MNNNIEIDWKKKFILFFESNLMLMERQLYGENDPVLVFKKEVVENYYENLRIEFEIPQEEIDEFKSTESFKRYMNGD